MNEVLWLSSPVVNVLLTLFVLLCPQVVEDYTNNRQKFHKEIVEKKKTAVPSLKSSFRAPPAWMCRLVDATSVETASLMSLLFHLFWNTWWWLLKVENFQRSRVMTQEKKKNSTQYSVSHPRTNWGHICLMSDSWVMVRAVCSVDYLHCMCWKWILVFLKIKKN